MYGIGNTFNPKVILHCQDKFMHNFSSPRCKDVGTQNRAFLRTNNFNNSFVFTLYNSPVQVLHIIPIHLYMLVSLPCLILSQSYPSQFGVSISNPWNYAIICLSLQKRNQGICHDKASLIFSNMGKQILPCYIPTRPYISGSSTQRAIYYNSSFIHLDPGGFEVKSLYIRRTPDSNHELIGLKRLFLPATC